MHRNLLPLVLGFALGAGLAAYFYTRLQVSTAATVAVTVAVIALLASLCLLFIRGRRLYDALRRRLNKPLTAAGGAGGQVGRHLQAGVQSPWFVLPAAGFSLVEIYSRLGGGSTAYAQMQEAGLLPAADQGDPNGVSVHLDGLQANPERMHAALGEVLDTQLWDEAMAGMGSAEGTDEGGGGDRTEAQGTPDMFIPVTVLVGFFTSLLRHVKQIRRQQLRPGTATRFVAIDTVASMLAGVSWWSGASLATVLLPTAAGWVPVVLAGGITTALAAPVIGGTTAQLRSREYERAVGGLARRFADLGEAAARADRLRNLMGRTPQLVSDARQALAQARRQAAGRVSWRALWQPSAATVLAGEQILLLENKVWEAEQQAGNLSRRLEDMATRARHHELGEIVYLNQGILLADTADLTSYLDAVDQAMVQVQQLRRYHVSPNGEQASADSLWERLRDIMRERLPWGSSREA